MKCNLKYATDQLPHRSLSKPKSQFFNEAMNLSMDNKVICTIFILEYKNSQFGLTGDEIWNKGL
jgi:hypothetical protein